jgi:membrane protease YdiL (CAAX protease family)
VIACLLAILFEIPLLAVFLAIDSAELDPGTLVTSALATTGVLAAVYVLYLIQVGAWVTRWERRRFGTVGLTRERAGRNLLRGAGLGVAAYLALLGLLGSLGLVETRSQPSLGLGLVVPAAVIALLGWGVQALGEEVIYRGWLLQVVAARTSIGIGVALSTAIFTVTHFIVGEINVVLLVNLVLFGVFWSLWALREGGLWGVFGWHAVTSWVSENLVVLGEGVGYGRLQNGLLLGMRETGPDSLTGGDIGLEASILTSAMLVIGIAVLSFTPLRRTGPGPG